MHEHWPGIGVVRRPHSLHRLVQTILPVFFNLNTYLFVNCFSKNVLFIMEKKSQPAFFEKIIENRKNWEEWKLGDKWNFPYRYSLAVFGGPACMVWIRLHEWEILDICRGMCTNFHDSHADRQIGIALLFASRLVILSQWQHHCVFLVFFCWLHVEPILNIC